MASDTRTRLLNAATEEFNEKGFAGTDTNQIARQAGFAPQTFYRWFDDKTQIFIAAYRGWEDIEREALEELLRRDASAEQLVEVVVSHHSRYKIFRRSLRQLSLENPQVREARAASRRRQVEAIQVWQQKLGQVQAESSIAVALLQMERLADALAERELEDMNLSPVLGRQTLAALIESLLART